MSKPLWLQLTCAKDDAKRYGEEGTTLRRLWGMYVATHSHTQPSFPEGAHVCAPDKEFPKFLCDYIDLLKAKPKDKPSDDVPDHEPAGFEFIQSVKKREVAIRGRKAFLKAAELGPVYVDENPYERDLKATLLFEWVTCPKTLESRLNEMARDL